MKAAVDSNVLFDVLLADRSYCERSRNLLNEYSEKSDLIICEAVYAEIASQFESEDEVQVFLSDTRIRYLPADRKVLHLAGRLWKQYVKARRNVLQCPYCGHRMTIACKSCGEPIRSRQRVLNDFVIGAHALTHADVLLSRDRGFYRRYFKGLSVAAQL